MKNILFGLLGAIAIALPVQAQSFESYPFDECPGIIINYICHDRVDTNPSLYSIPTGFDSQLGLGGIRLGVDSNVIFVADFEADQVIAYLYVNDRGRLIPNPSGMPNINNPRLLSQMTEEIVTILNELVLY